MKIHFYNQKAVNQKITTFKFSENYAIEKGNTYKSN